MATRAKPIPANKAIVPTRLSTDDLQALLGATGAVAQGGGEYHRLTLNGGILQSDDGEMFPPKKNGPALIVRIVSPPVYYNAFFLSEKRENGSIDAEIIGRADLNGRFSRKYDDPAAQAADNNAANDVFDEIARVTGTKGSFKADLEAQIVPEDGNMTGEETVYTISISTTSVFEWRGSSKSPFTGSVSKKNTMVELAELAIQNAIDAGLDEDGQKQAVVTAVTALRLGGVVAEVYPLQMANEDKSRTWWVLHFKPIHIAPIEDTPTLESGNTSGDVPF